MPLGGQQHDVRCMTTIWGHIVPEFLSAVNLLMQ